MPTLPNLTINPQRLWDSLMETAAFGASNGGIKRLTLSDEDRQVRDWFKAACERVGCTVAIDDCGNMFARRPGKRNDLEPICMGSHLDTQPTGGKFDGVLGVLGALEVLRTLHDMGYETQAPIEVINWTNEEGARYAPAMLASGVFAGAFTRDYAYAREDRDGKRFDVELERIGYKGDELHIEQGPILEAESKMIGVVTGVQGMRWYEVRVHGQSAHTGATPMHLRKNALLGAARMVEAIHQVAMDHAPDAVGTVGLMEVQPNSRNVVPGEVFFCVDLRHKDEAVLLVMEDAFRAALPQVLEPLGLTFEEKMIWNSPAVQFNPDLIACVREGAAKSGYAMRDMVSGAGHDAAYIARVAPTTMIFVPCAGGVSHNESESTSFDECGAGTQVLLDAVLAYDQRLG
jgi:beta-ureidopropionase / N-carbamoyl-L-amino-acid hydrolase